MKQCEQCLSQPNPQCDGILPGDTPGRWVRCDRVRRETAESMLYTANLDRLYDLDPELDPTAAVTLIEAVDIEAGSALAAGMISAYLLDGQTAILYHLPGQAARGWELLRDDFLSPAFIGFLWPDQVQGQQEFRDAVHQAVLGRVIDGRPMVVTTLGTWNPRTPIEGMLRSEIERRRTT